MSGFTDRSVQRALGKSGGIRPRIAPLTAPDPGMSGDPPVGLEIVEEIEARPGPVDGRRAREHVAREERLGAAPERVLHGEPEPSPHVERGAVPALASAPREDGSWLGPALRSEELEDEPVRSSPAGAPAIPSFRAHRLDRGEALVASAASISHRAYRLEERVETVSVRARREPPPRPRGEPTAEAPQVPAIEAELAMLGSIASEHGRATTPAAEHGRATPRPRAPAMEVEPSSPWPSADAALEVASRPLGRRRGDEASGPVVRIDIGSVEVRAAPLPPPRRRSSIAQPASFVSLQQYLHKRGGA